MNTSSSSPPLAVAANAEASNGNIKSILERFETPKIVQSAHQENFSTLTLDQYRNIVVDAARGRVVVAPMTFFQESVLRDISAKDVNAVHQRLVKVGAIASDGRWAEFKKAPSSMTKAELLAEKGAFEEGKPTAASSQTLENLVYEKLLVVHSAICKAAAEEFGEEATVAFVSRPNTFSRSPHTNGHFKSDGAGTRVGTRDPRPANVRSAGDLDYLPDCTSLEEYKLKRNVQNYNHVIPLYLVSYSGFH